MRLQAPRGLRLQPPLCTVASPAVHGCSLPYLRLQVLVFREEAVLAALLPALFGAWAVLSPGFAPAAADAHACRLLDDLQRELVYISDKPAARRAYFGELPVRRLQPILQQGRRPCAHGLQACARGGCNHLVGWGCSRVLQPCAVVRRGVVPVRGE